MHDPPKARPLSVSLEQVKALPVYALQCATDEIMKYFSI